MQKSKSIFHRFIFIMDDQSFSRKTDSIHYYWVKFLQHSNQMLLQKKTVSISFPYFFGHKKSEKKTFFHHQHHHLNLLAKQTFWKKKFWCFFDHQINNIYWLNRHIKCPKANIFSHKMSICNWNEKREFFLKIISKLTFFFLYVSFFVSLHQYFLEIHWMFGFVMILAPQALKLNFGSWKKTFWISIFWPAGGGQRRATEL